jgi:cobalt-zinc-cadmium efflux system outer membrane protein
MKRLKVPFLVAAACLGPRAAAGQDGVLTLESALERARTHSLPVVSARHKVEEARARLRGARALRDNPVVEGALGLRDDEQPNDYALGLSQTLELGGRRGARTRAAQAALEREAALASDTGTRTLREVAFVFLRALAARERLRLARSAEADAESVQRIAERRHAVGDVARLDVNLAVGALARARSAAAAAAATEALALGELRVLLALPADFPLTLSGEVGPRPARDLAALLEAAGRRADLQAAEAERRQAQAEIEAGKGQRWPDVTPAVRYERDEGTNVVWGGLTLSLPVFSRGQEQRGAAEARAARLDAELAALRQAARVEVESAFEAQRLRLEALAVLRDAAARIEENEALARRSYDVGQIGLAELLLVRRETLDAQLSHLERRLDAAEGEIELMARAGVLR